MKTFFILFIGLIVLATLGCVGEETNTTVEVKPYVLDMQWEISKPLEDNYYVLRNKENMYTSLKIKNVGGAEAKNVEATLSSCGLKGSDKVNKIDSIPLGRTEYMSWSLSAPELPTGSSVDCETHATVCFDYETTATTSLNVIPQSYVGKESLQPYQSQSLGPINVTFSTPKYVVWPQGTEETTARLYFTIRNNENGYVESNRLKYIEISVKSPEDVKNEEHTWSGRLNEAEEEMKRCKKGLKFIKAVTVDELGNASPVECKLRISCPNTQVESECIAHFTYSTTNVYHYPPVNVYMGEQLYYDKELIPTMARLLSLPSDESTHYIDITFNTTSQLQDITTIPVTVKLYYRYCLNSPSIPIKLQG